MELYRGARDLGSSTGRACSYQGSSVAACSTRLNSMRRSLGPAPTVPTRTSAGHVREFTQINFAGRMAVQLSCSGAQPRARFGHGLSFLTGFSWQKSMDLLSNTAFEGPGNTHPYGQIEQDYGVSNFHRAARFTRHSTTSCRALAANSPFALRSGGWQTNGIVTLQSGSAASP